MVLYVDGSASQDPQTGSDSAVFCSGHLPHQPREQSSPILHHMLLAQLLESILLPTALADCKCVAHTSVSDDISKGDACADTAAEAATRLPFDAPQLDHIMVSLPSSHSSAVHLVSRVDATLVPILLQICWQHLAGS